MDEGVTDSILSDIPPITVAIALIGGPFQVVFTKREYVTEIARRVCPSLSIIRESVECEVWDFLLYSLRQQVPRQAETGVYPYTFLRSEPSRPLAAQSSPYATYNLRGWYHFPSSPPPLGDGTVYRCEEVPLTVGPVHIDGRDVSFQVHPYPERIVQHEAPTTYCFDCGQMVPITDTWTKKNDPNYALCEACFRVAEGAGRAKEGMIL